jgi:hypothetical protein
MSLAYGSAGGRRTVAARAGSPCPGPMLRSPARTCLPAGPRASTLCGRRLHPEVTRVEAGNTQQSSSVRAWAAQVVHRGLQGPRPVHSGVITLGIMNGAESNQNKIARTPFLRGFAAGTAGPPGTGLAPAWSSAGAWFWCAPPPAVGPGHLPAARGFGGRSPEPLPPRAASFVPPTAWTATAVPPRRPVRVAGLTEALVRAPAAGLVPPVDRGRREHPV